jgi:RHS repeat-associated protein
VTTLAYDYEGRITGITYPNSSTNSFVYNGMDTRVSKTDSTGTRTYTRDGAYVTDPVLDDGAALYTPGVSERRGSDTTFSHSGLKNMDAQSVVNETVSATREYDAFGNVVSGSGTWNGPFGYAGGFGYQEDPDSGLKLLGHRYYDPSTGRFLTRDPAKEGRNWYAYCDGEPTKHVDSQGLVKIILFWYHVFGGGYHAGILIIDNAKGGTEPIYSFAGGPQHRGTIYAGKLVSRSGPWKAGTQDYDSVAGRWDGSGVVLVDDDSPAQGWIDRFRDYERDMKDEIEVRYDLIGGRGAANSNSWARELIDRADLRDEYEKARRKRGGAPIVPGWNSDVWKRK